MTSFDGNKDVLAESLATDLLAALAAKPHLMTCAACNEVIAESAPATYASVGPALVHKACACAAKPAEELDVELLARAIGHLPDRHNATIREFAIAIAAEYVRLQEGSEE